MNKMLFTFVFASFCLSGIQASYSMDENKRKMETTPEKEYTKKLTPNAPKKLKTLHEPLQNRNIVMGLNFNNDFMRRFETDEHRIQ